MTESTLTKTDTGQDTAQQFKNFLSLILTGELIRRAHGYTAHRLFIKHVLASAFPDVPENVSSLPVMDEYLDSDQLLSHLETLRVDPHTEVDPNYYHPVYSALYGHCPNDEGASVPEDIDRYDNYDD